jgi:hypothetical protein
MTGSFIPAMLDGGDGLRTDSRQGDRIMAKSQNTKKTDKKKPAKTMKEKKQAKKDKKDQKEHPGILKT